MQPIETEVSRKNMMRSGLLPSQVLRSQYESGQFSSVWAEWWLLFQWPWTWGRRSENDRISSKFHRISMNFCWGKLPRSLCHGDEHKVSPAFRPCPVPHQACLEDLVGRERNHRVWWRSIAWPQVGHEVLKDWRWQPLPLASKPHSRWTIVFTWLYSNDCDVVYMNALTE